MKSYKKKGKSSKILFLGVPEGTFSKGEGSAWNLSEKALGGWGMR